jgi:hypothetical protein
MAMDEKMKHSVKSSGKENLAWKPSARQLVSRTIKCGFLKKQPEGDNGSGVFKERWFVLVKCEADDQRSGISNDTADHMLVYFKEARSPAV